MHLDFKKGSKQHTVFKSSEKFLWKRCFWGGSSSGRISVSVGRLIVTENTELFLKKKKNSSPGMNN